MNLEGKLETEARESCSISEATAIADLLDGSTKLEHLRKLTQLTEEYGGYNEEFRAINEETAR